MMARSQLAPASPGQHVVDHVLNTVQDGTVLMGTPGSLAHALNVSVSEMRAALRSLLESGKIAVGAEAQGQITVRLERRQVEALPALPPALERRRPQPDLWIL